MKRYKAERAATVGSIPTPRHGLVLAIDLRRQQRLDVRCLVERIVELVISFEIRQAAQNGMLRLSPFQLDPQNFVFPLRPTARRTEQFELALNILRVRGAN